jgi:hypothetical protein
MNTEPWYWKTVHAVVVSACAVVVMLFAANDPSADDVVKGGGVGLAAWIGGFLSGRK